MDELRAEGYPITSHNEYTVSYDHGGKLGPSSDIPDGATAIWNGQKIAEAKAIRIIPKDPIDEIELRETYFRANRKIVYEGTIIVDLIDSGVGGFGSGIEERAISGIKRYGAFAS